MEMRLLNDPVKVSANSLSDKARKLPWILIIKKKFVKCNRKFRDPIKILEQLIKYFQI